MLIATFICGLLGVVVARSIVAEADAHRRELPDRWYGPVCAECGSGLGLLLTSCRDHGHTQRRTNIIVFLGTIALSAVLPLAAPSLWLLPAFLVFLWTMILLTVTDVDTKLIPNRILGPSTGIGIGLLLVGYVLDRTSGSLVDAAIGAAAYFGVMFLLALAVKGGLGFGDVKLAFLIGFFTGYLGLGHVAVAGIGSFLIGGTVSALLLITRTRSRRDAIPFGPFMTIAATATIFFGSEIVAWYLR